MAQDVLGILVRRSIRSFTWNRLDWRKLLLVCFILASVGILLPPFLFPRFRMSLDNDSIITRLTGISDEPRVEKFKDNDSIITRLTGISDEARVEKFNNVVSSTVPIVYANSTIMHGRGRRRRRKSFVDDGIKVVVMPPPRDPVPDRLKRRVWRLSPKDAMVYAKKEMDNVPLITEDPYLYAPIFRNLSVFKRSYELMELILKVYVYPDGQRPIFHDPLLVGIYASEGWFMKFIETTREFTTRDPERAHLFYLPFSTKQLSAEMYTPGSHNLRPLAVFVSDYVDMLAAKYPFWNRTRGRDHFLVSCHDWGPYTTRLHDELPRNSIRALCNADFTEGFRAGKDVSLPETLIKNPSRPLRNIGGGMRVSQRPILAFFAGKMHGAVRPVLLEYWENKDDDMKIYSVLPNRVSRRMSYTQHMKSSKYCICPRGYEVNSPRIVEAIYYECIPVIIADNFVLPLSEVLDWSAFSVVVAEKDIPKLKEILLAIPLKKYLTMLYNLKMVQKHFLWNRTPLRYDAFHMILHSIWFSRLNHVQIPES